MVMVDEGLRALFFCALILDGSSALFLKVFLDVPEGFFWMFLTNEYVPE